MRYVLSPHHNKRLVTEGRLQVGTSIGGGLEKADLAARIYSMASSFASENRSIDATRTMLKNSGFLRDPKAGDVVIDLAAMFQELAIRLEDTFHFTDEQKVCLRLRPHNSTKDYSSLIQVNIRQVCQNLI